VALGPRFVVLVASKERVSVTPHPPKIEVMVSFANGGSLTPEDLALIEAIRSERSILAASRATGVSYRKCWLMVDALNRTFETPVFATFPGRRGAGAQLTDFGEQLVALYQSMERRSRNASAQSLAELNASLNRSYRPRASGGAGEGVAPQPRLSRWRRS
jgi:molybdate transport system regulatory protein